MNFKLFLGNIKNSPKKKFFVFLFLGLIVLVGVFFLWKAYFPTERQVEAPSPKEEKKVFYAPFSGLEVTEERSKKRPVAVVIENHPNSRPQSGLNKADIIFEAVAEGGITRFLAVYQSREGGNEIGPVRSARSYYVEWASFFDALFAHVGGSQEALRVINRLSVDSINQFFMGDFFWRDNRRFAPHNVYTTTEKIREAATTKGYRTIIEDEFSYLFKEDVDKESRPIGQKVTVNLTGGYAPTYEYSPQCNCYHRFIMGAPQKDRSTAENIFTKNIIVAFSDVSKLNIRGEAYSVIRTTGEGEAYIFQDGKKIVGEWRQKSGDIVRFYDSTGAEVRLNRGSTWINVVDKSTTVSVVGS